ncbi:ROK family protein [Riemerella anatipestifer]|nr:ROK family protein [Riemerella anatipestifer]
MTVSDLSSRMALGIDIGGTNTKFGLVNHRGEILGKGRIKTDYDDIDDFINTLYKEIEPILEQHDAKSQLEGIGIGAPNGNYYKGTIENAPNLKWKGIVPLAEKITAKFGVPCKVTNDANAAAYGEMMFGAARGMKDFIMITLGTGVGSGVIANGQLVYGHDGFAGELRAYHSETWRKKALEYRLGREFRGLCFCNRHCDNS